MSTLDIRDLHVSVTEGDGTLREILRGVDLTVKDGETHAIMGPNGSGKSTLAYAIAGHPKYLVTKGSVRLDGEDVLALSVDWRARAGLFLAMQYPVEVPGDRVGQRGLAGAVRSHDGVRLPFGHRQVHAAQDLPQGSITFRDGNVEIADGKGGHYDSSIATRTSSSSIFTG